MEQNEIIEKKKSIIQSILDFFNENGLDIIKFTKSLPVYIDVKDPFDDYQLLKYNIDLVDSDGNVEAIYMDGEDFINWSLNDMDDSDLINIFDLLFKKEYIVY